LLAQKARRPAADNSARRPDAGFQAGKLKSREAILNWRGCLSGIPQTAFAAAFLRALARLAARRPDSSIEIVLPTGAAKLGEIELVLRALGLIRDRRAR
jgi:hypothetical protein